MTEQKLDGTSILPLNPNLRGRLKHDFALNKVCWFGTGGPAALFYQPADIPDLRVFLLSLQPDASLLILGAGSNMLIRDEGFRGIVLRLGRHFNYITHDPERPLELRVGAATLDAYIPQEAEKHGIGGLEFFAGIPGTMGGALAMNAGCYGCDTATRLVSALAINRIDGSLRTFLPTEIGFGYRSKCLGAEWIFLEATLRGYSADPQVIATKIKQIQTNRAQSQPVNSRTAGSTFKNPPQCSAWELIAAAGCRELKLGGAQVSSLHCNFLTNTGSATSQDIEELIAVVAQRVHHYSGFKLQPEIIIVGSTPDDGGKNETLMKKLAYRSKYRGSREMDFILTRFATDQIHHLTTSQLSLYGMMLDLPDEMLYKAILAADSKSITRHLIANRQATPPRPILDAEVFILLQAIRGTAQSISETFPPQASPHPNHPAAE